MKRLRIVNPDGVPSHTTVTDVDTGEEISNITAIEIVQKAGGVPLAKISTHGPVLDVVAQPVTPLNLDVLVARFLGWRLPKTFSPDCGIHYTPISNSQPIGTNLFTAEEARQMFEYVLNGFVEARR